MSLVVEDLVEMWDRDEENVAHIIAASGMRWV
jgi:hypothetical protein